MKTKNLLVAMALPTLFAACTAEEIVNQAENNVSLENRALLGDLIANVEGKVASRASWSEEDLAWGAWEEDDAFAAALVDAKPGDVDNNLLTNYVYKKNAAGEWTTTSQMVEGIYSFYSYKGITTKNDRKPVAFDIRAQKANLNEPTKVLDDHQLFFSPLYIVDADNTTAENNIALPLAFYPYHSAGMFYIKNNSGQDLKISQIILKGSFGAKGNILPTAIEDQDFVYSVREWKGVAEKEYKLAAKTGRTETAAAVEYSAKEIAAMWEMSTLDDATAAEQIVLDCGKWTLKDGKEIMAYMNVPAGKQTTVAVEINVIDEEGNAKTIYVNDSGIDEDEDAETEGIESTNISKSSFKRGTATAVFGKNNGAPKAVVVKEENLSAAKGTYVDNETDLIKLINEGRGEIVIYNAEGLKITSAVAEALAANTACELNITNEISIEDFANTVELTNVTFAKKVTVKAEYKADGTTPTERGTIVVLGEGVIVGEEGIVVENYATATLANGEYNAVANKGTMTVYALGADVEELTNEGTLTVDNGNMPEETAATRSAATVNVPTITTTGNTTIVGMNPTVNFNGGKLSYVADVVSNKNVAFDVTGIVAATGKNLELTIGADVTLKQEFTYVQAYTAKNGTVAAKYLTIVLNGDWTLADKSFVGKLTNNGEISGTNGHLMIVGESSNDGDILVDYIDVLENAKLTNNGTIACSTDGSACNDGYIKNNSGAYLKLTREKVANLAATGASDVVATGRIENYGALEFATDAVKNTQTIYCVLNDASIADVETLNVTRYHYNAVQLTGTFTVDRDFGTGSKDADDNTAALTNVSALKILEFNGATLDMTESTEEIKISFEKMRIMGNVTMKGFTSAASVLSVFDNGGAACAIELDKAASLTVKNMTLQRGMTGANYNSNLHFVAPTLNATDDKVTDATNGDYWANAAKVYNKGVIRVHEANKIPTTFGKGTKATTTGHNLYWEGEAAILDK